MSVDAVAPSTMPRVEVSSLERRASTLVFLTGLGLLLGFAFWYGRGLWFFSDEWNVIAAHHAGNWTEGFNGQWLLIPVFVFWTLLKMFGIFEYLPFRVVGLVFYGLAIVLFHRWALRRVRPWAAALAALAVAWYSTSKNVVMMPLLMNFTIPVAMLFAAWMLLDRQGRRGDIGAAICLVVGILSSNVGLIVVFMVGIEFALRRVRRERWLVVVPAVVAWVPWYLFFYESIGPRAGVVKAFHWGVGLTENYARGFTWNWRLGQWMWLALLAGVLVWATVRRRWNPRAVATAGGIAGFVIAGSFRFAQYYIPTPPNPNWYLWLYSVLMMALIVELLRDTEIPWTVLVVFAVVVGASAFQLYKSLGDFRAAGVANKGNTRAWFAAADALGDRAPDDALLKVNLVPLRVSDYKSLRRAEGSLVPGVTLAMLGDESTRQIVDEWMLDSLGVVVMDGPGDGRSCRTSPEAANLTGEALSPGSVVRITTSDRKAIVRIRRFSSTFSAVPFAQIDEHRVVHLVIPADNSSLPWYLYVDATAQVERCG